MYSARRVALSINLTALAIGAGALIACFVTLGAVDYWIHPMGLFWLDGEHNAPATFSALLLVGAASVAVLLASEHAPGMGRRRIFGGLAALFAFMSLDEFESFHEHINDHFHFPWQAAYLPLLFVAAYLWWRALGYLRHYGPPAACWLAAAVAWGVAQLFDLYQTTILETNTHLTAFKVTVVLEEGLEMAGSTLFLLSLLLALHFRTSEIEHPARLPARRLFTPAPRPPRDPLSPPVGASRPSDSAHGGSRVGASSARS